jgi:hypothetical protein
MTLPKDSGQEFKFKTPRQERIFKKLCLIGFAPAAYYRDACRLATLDPTLDSITHLLGHLFREIEGIIVNFLLDENDRTALTNKDGAREQKIRVVLKKLGVQEEGEILSLWLESESLHKYAHRNGITRPRPPEDDFHEMLQKREEILDYVSIATSHIMLTTIDGLMSCSGHQSRPRKLCQNLEIMFPTTWSR